MSIIKKAILALPHVNSLIRFIYRRFPFIRVKRSFNSKKSELQEYKWAKLDSLAIKDNEKVLFVDLGANLGQGYKWYKQYFHRSNISFELFEPNPNCVKYLEKIDDVVSGKVKLHPVAVGVLDGYLDFYGLQEEEGGKYSQGGSIVREHNSNCYNLSKDKSIKVNVINFSRYLRDKASEFDKIIVKMDIEGAEVDLLEALIKEKTIHLINVLYIEFHSQYQTKNLSLITRQREEKILKNLSYLTNVTVRIGQ
jgi:FkbM family methyltransferase